MTSRRSWVPGGLIPYALAAGLGLAAALWLLPLPMLLGWNATASPFAGDIGQHIIGQRYFLADAWRWPPLTAEGLGWPDGTNIAFTDSIPLESLLLKLIRTWLPPGFEGVHLWLGLCYLLQPVAAVFALRGTGERRIVPAVSAAILALAMPALWFRFIHPALSSHFLLLVALGLYLRLCRAEPHLPLLAGAAFLLPVTMLVHPYLFLMVAALLAAAPASLALRGGRWQAVGLAMAAGLGVSAGLAWALGYGDAMPIEGFGMFSMNLLSPVFPDMSGLFPGRALPYGAPEQNDGYNYLGAGLILLIVAATWVVARGRAPGLLRRHAGLALCCLALTLLALSSRAYAGRWLLYRVPDLPAVIEQFRGSGRLFWPVAYVLAIGSTSVVARAGRPAACFAVLLAMAGLQVADASANAGLDHEKLRRRTPWMLNPAVMRPLLAHYDLLRLRPKFACGGDFLKDAGFREMSEFASERALPIDTVYAARLVRTPECFDGMFDSLRPGELRVFLQAMARYAADVPGAARFCRQYQAMMFCTLREDDLEALSAAELVLRPVPLDTPVSAARGGFQDLLGRGWCDPDKGGTWTCSPRADLNLGIANGPSPPASIVLWGQAIGPRTGQPQRITFSIGPLLLASFELPDLTPGKFVIPLHGAIGPQTPVELHIDVAQPTAPNDRGLNGDKRMLGFWLSSVALERQR